MNTEKKFQSGHLHLTSDQMELLHDLTTGLLHLAQVDHDGGTESFVQINTVIKLDRTGFDSLTILNLKTIGYANK